MFRGLRYALLGVLMTVGGAATAEELSTNVADFDFRQPRDLVRALQKLGYRAQVKPQKDGKPYVAGAANGNDFSIYFYECDAMSVHCKSFEFYSWWKKEPFFSIALANSWNAQKRFLKVAIDAEGDLEQRLYASGVGMTEANFAEVVDWYVSSDAEMGRFLDAEKAKTAAPRK